MPAVDDGHIRYLIESAAEALARGRAQDAQRMLQQAQNEAPEHPLVLNEIGRRELLAGNSAGAYRALEKAAQLQPANASVWVNLAAALRGLQRPDEEMRALDKALALEPRNLRALLQKASVQELQGDLRTAAATYRTALQTIPPGAEVPPAMRPTLQHARDVVEANNRALEGFLENRLAALRTRFAAEPLARFDSCLATILQKRRIYRQQPTFLYYPNLPGIEFHERSQFPWLDSLEAATPEIREELLSVLADGPSVLQPYVSHAAGVPLDQWRDLNHSRRWGVYFLWKEGTAFPEHIARCPRTVSALQCWPRWEVSLCGPTAVFSILEAKTRIPPHTGVNNARLIIHLPLIVPPGCGFRVGAEQREWIPGKAFVFDDTIEHEAWNDSDVPRAVLILDIWSPLLSTAEREMVSTLTAAVGEYYASAPLAQRQTAAV
jgi:aspartate beta-hydroxylase